MKYVIFPGTAGNYLSTPDVNLLDADTAHMLQSIGLWGNASAATGFALSTDVAPSYGDTVLRWESNTVGAFTGRTGYGIEGTPVTADTDYSIGIDLASPDGLSLTAFGVRQFDSAGNVLLTDVIDVGPVGPTLQRVERTITTHADAAYWTLWITFESTAIGQYIYADAAIIRLGTDPTFIPSLRITGSLEAEAKVNVPAHTGEWRAFISTAFNEDGFMLRQEQSSPVAGLLHADGTWRAGESTNQIPADQWMTIQGMAELGVEYRFVFNNVPAGSDSINANPGVPSGKDLTIGTWLSGSGPDQDFIGSMSYALARDGIDGPVVASFDAEDIVLP